MKIKQRAGTYIVEGEPADIEAFNAQLPEHLQPLPADKSIWAIWERLGGLLETNPEETDSPTFNAFIYHLKVKAQRAGARIP